MGTAGSVTYDRRYRSLDAARGVAALSVLVWHRYYLRAEWAQQLWLGVQVFFVISGYCIAAATDRGLSAGGGFRSFMRRRVRRIAPPYYASLAVGLARKAGGAAIAFGAGAGLAELELPWRIWLENLTMTQWLSAARYWIRSGFGFATPWSNSHLLVAVHWSLNYEEQFYLLAAGLIALSRIARPWLLVVALTAGVALVNAGKPGLITGFFLDYWLQFAIGIFLYWRLCLCPAAFQRAADIGLGISVAGLLGLALHRGELPLHNEPIQFVGQLAFCLTCAALFRALRPFDDAIADSLVGRTCGRAGAFSYSLYLIHQELLYAFGRVDTFIAPRFGWPVADVLALVSVVYISYVFYLVFERPFLTPALAKLRNLNGAAPSRP